jgi:hypothetical protein
MIALLNSQDTKPLRLQHSHDFEALLQRVGIHPHCPD